MDPFSQQQSLASRLLWPALGQVTLLIRPVTPTPTHLRAITWLHQRPDTLNLIFWANGKEKRIIT